VISIKVFEPLAVINSLLITPSPSLDRGNLPETRLGIKSRKQGDVILNLPALARIHTIHGGEEVS